MRKYVLCLAACLLLSMLSGCGGPFRHAGVLEIEGGVTLTRGDGEPEALSGEQAALKDGDALRTDPGANAWLRLDENKTVLLDEDTEMDLAYAGGGFRLTLQRGGILVRIDKPLGTAETFDVAVGKLLLGVRGTVFSVALDAGGSALLNVYQGRVAVTDMGGSELTTVEKGYSVRFDPDRGSLSGEAGPIDYAALSALFAESVADYARESMAQASQGESPLPQDTEEPGAQEAEPENTGDPDAPEAEPSGEAVPPAEGAAPPAATPAPVFFTVIFDLDGGRLGSATGSILTEVESGQGAAPPKGIVKDGYTFTGWMTQRGGDAPAALGRITANTTVYAKWEPIDAPAVAPILPQPQVQFSYLWDGEHFQPAADVDWASGGESAYLLWQVYDGGGKALSSSGRIEGADGAVSVKQEMLSLSHPAESGLYPKGYVLRLTPYCTAGGIETALDPVEMALPYLEFEEAAGAGPVLSTNVGLYFRHSYDSLAVTREGDRSRAAGRLHPLSGADVTLEVEVWS